MGSPRTPAKGSASERRASRHQAGPAAALEHAEPAGARVNEHDLVGAGNHDVELDSLVAVHRYERRLQVVLRELAADLVPKGRLQAAAANRPGLLVHDGDDRQAGAANRPGGRSCEAWHRHVE
jgi:hypothetical protein